MLLPGLSMLWESVEPKAALAERFGFQDMDAVTRWVSVTLQQRWGITVVDCPRMVISDQNAVVWASTDTGALVVKWSRARDQFQKLHASTCLLRTLADGRVPVAAPIETNDGVVRIILEGPTCALSVSVQPELTGTWLDVNNRSAVLSAGKCLGLLHDALGSIRPHESLVSPRSGRLKERIGCWMENGDRGYAPDASRRLAGLVSAAPEFVDAVQLLHNDFRSANILTRDSVVIGVLDFDTVTTGHRANDLAKASTYLGTLFTDWRPTPTAVQQALRAGYESVRPLGGAEAEWFEIFHLWQGILAVPANDTAGWAAAAL